MEEIKKSKIKKIIYILLGVIIIFSTLYFLMDKAENRSKEDPVFCENDDECTYYNVVGCSKPQSINKTYKDSILKLPKNESLCGSPKTECIDYECVMSE